MDRAFGLYVAGDSALHRLHPLTKLALAGLLLAAGLLLPGVWLTYAAFGLALLPLAALGGVAGRLLRAVGPVVLPFAVSVFLIQGLLWPGGTPVAALGPLALKREGLAFAAASVGRILMVVGSFVLFALTTRPDRLMLALTQRGLPPQLAYLVVATLQIVPRFQARAAAILDAQRARGLETSGSLARRARALAPLVVPLILSSLVDVEERALALEARAFNRSGPKTSLTAIGEAAWEPALRWALAAGAAALALGRLALLWLG
jgi:energy-coupling factor transport system permease protein